MATFGISGQLHQPCGTGPGATQVTARLHNLCKPCRGCGPETLTEVDVATSMPTGVTMPGVWASTVPVADDGSWVIDCIPCLDTWAMPNGKAASTNYVVEVTACSMHWLVLADCSDGGCVAANTMHEITSIGAPL